MSTRINVYSSSKDPKKRGEITIMYDRIIHIQFTIPIVYHYPERIAFEAEAERKGIPLKKEKIYDLDVQYKFAIRKISRAHEAFRSDRKLNYELLSKDLSEHINGGTLLIRLDTLQKAKILYQLRKYVWQTKDFKKHIYYYLATSFLSFLGGLIIGWKILKTDKTPPSSINTLQKNGLIKEKKQEGNKNYTLKRDSTSQ